MGGFHPSIDQNGQALANMPGRDLAELRRAGVGQRDLDLWLAGGIVAEAFAEAFGHHVEGVGVGALEDGK